MTIPTVAADLERYLPDEAWFRRAPRGIHGAPHTTRVLIWSAVLADVLASSGAIQGEELLWAAAVHDVGRMDDGVDPGHGVRSAAWAVEHLPRLRPEAARLDLGFLAELCIRHETWDREIPRLTLELMILKDADALDRCRIFDLDPARLRLARSLELVTPAEALERATNDYGRVTASDVLMAYRRLAGESR